MPLGNIYGETSRINTNVAGLNMLNNLSQINGELTTHQLRLATGKRINSVGEDAAGFVIGRKLEARSRGLSVAMTNTSDAKNVLSIAEGGMEQISQILLTLKERATQAANDTLSSNERSAIQNLTAQLISEINDIVSETTFNNFGLIDGTYTGKNFQTGEGVEDGLAVSLSQSVSTGALGLNNLNLTTSAATATAALASINAAINTISSELQYVGALLNRLSAKEGTLAVAITNTESARSRIIDADMAKEQLETTKFQILQQTATSMLSQANTAPQSILSLFQ